MTDNRPVLEVYEADVAQFVAEAPLDAAFYAVLALAERLAMLAASETSYLQASAFWARSNAYRAWAADLALQAEKRDLSLLESAWGEKGRVVAR